jgi:hypothetical protein
VAASSGSSRRSSPRPAAIPYVYVVENVKQGDPKLFTLKVLDGDLLARVLERAREKHYFEVPLPVAIYDSCPTTLEPSSVRPGPLS